MKELGGRGGARSNFEPAFAFVEELDMSLLYVALEHEENMEETEVSISSPNVTEECCWVRRWGPLVKGDEGWIRSWKDELKRPFSGRIECMSSEISILGAILVWDRGDVNELGDPVTVVEEASGSIGDGKMTEVRAILAL